MTTKTTSPAAVAPRGAADEEKTLSTGAVGSTGSTGAETKPSVSEPLRPPAERGRTSIADSVVEKIAGMAAREVPGVFALGGGLARTLGAVRDRVPGSRPNVARGVKVEVGERQTAVDLDIVVEYGVSIGDVAVDIRENVVEAVERMTALEVVEVNISVIDVRLPDDEEEEPETRVQ